MPAKIALTAVAMLCALVVAPDLARACSCIQIAPRDQLASGTPALIGEVVAKVDAGPIGQPAYDQLYDYTVRLERAFNLDAGGEIVVRGNSSGAACGFAWSVGDRVGAFLSRSGDTWSTGSCLLIGPDALETAAKPQPTPPGPPLPPVSPPGPPGASPLLRARSGAAVVDAGARSGRLANRLVVGPRARIRLRLDEPAQAVKVAFARADGQRVSGMRTIEPAGDRRLVWLVRLPRSLPARTDRLLVSVDFGRTRSTVAVGLTRDGGSASSRRAPCPVLAG